MKRILLIFVFCAVTALGAVATQAGPLDNIEPLSLDLENVPLSTVLNSIARQNGLNLVMSGDVVGEITLRLDRVDVVTALDAILLPMGYNYSIRDDVVVVKPAADVSSSELETRIITLRYLVPITAAKALESLKSDQGHVTILDRTALNADGQRSAASPYRANRVLLVDFPPIVERMAALIDEMDVRERAISIEARIIETNVDDNSKVGFSWPSSLSAVFGGGSDSSSSASLSSIDGAAVTYDPNNGDVSWATLSAGQVEVILHMLEENGNSRLVSDPRVTTLENHEAEIKITTVIPIATISRFTEAAATQDIVTFQDEEVGISLIVRPRINEGGTITMEVEPTVEDIIGFAGPTDNQKPITTSRSVRTTITVEDGETLVLGGLRKEDEIESRRRVPLLGHIPVLGNLLFTHTSKEKKTSDLIILITPRLLP